MKFLFEISGKSARKFHAQLRQNEVAPKIDFSKQRDMVFKILSKSKILQEKTKS